MTAIVVALIHVVAFFGIGLLGAAVLNRRKIIDKHFIVITAYAISCLIYYVLFYVYALSPAVGRYFTVSMYGLGSLSAIYLLRWLQKDVLLRKVFKKAVLPVLIILFSLATLYSTITFSCHYRNSAPDTPWIFYQACVLYDATGDNILPQLFGQKLIANQEHERLGDWYLADRPPIEVGGVVSILDLLPNDTSSDTRQSSVYEFFSIILQLSWVPALWALLNAMRILKKNQFYIILLSSVTGFYYYNSIYGWPKMLSASFGIAALALILYRSINTRTAEAKDWVLASIFVSLSLLAHGSAFYLVLPLVIYLLFYWRLPSIKVLIICTMAFLALYGPWAVYQHRMAPNQRLTKWQLAGVISAEDKRPASKAILDSYRGLSFNQWAKDRAHNVGFLFRADYVSYWGRVTDQPSKEPFLVHVAKDPSEKSLLDKLRKQEFFALFPALGLLNIGWIALFYRKRHKLNGLPAVMPLLTIAAIGTAAWVIISFIPGSTLNFTNSYAVMMIIFTALLSAIATSPKLIRNSVLVLQFIFFYMVWIYGLYKINHQLQILVPITILVTAVYLFAARSCIKDGATESTSL